MKKYLKNIITLLILCISINLNSQTYEQARSFINKTHIAIAKVQKEMYYSNNIEYNIEIKKAIKLQMISLKLFKESNFKEATNYSFWSRSQCIEICSKMNISEGTWYVLNEEEKQYCNTNNIKVTIKLNDFENKKINELNILDVSKFREIDLNIK